jgi:hypothetical protein
MRRDMYNVNKRVRTESIFADENADDEVSRIFASGTRRYGCR